MAGSQPKLTQEQVIEALAKCKGLIFLTAKSLGVSHDTIERMIKRHPAVAEARKQQRGEMVDEAEGTLWKAIRNGESWAIAFTLKCLGKDRGYTERTEVSGPGGGDISVTVKMNDEERASAIRSIFQRYSVPGEAPTPSSGGGDSARNGHTTGH